MGYTMAMSQPPPLPGDPPPVPRRPIATALAWIVIIASVLTILGIQTFNNRPVTPSGDVRADAAIQLRLTGRYLVGVKSFMDRLGAAQPKLGGELASQLPAVVKSPLDEVRAAPIVGELSGAAAAVQWLDRIATDDPGLIQDIFDFRDIYHDAQVPGPDERQRLIERHGWFAELALSAELPEANPARAAVLAPARRTMLALIGLVVIAGMGFIAGITLAAVAIYRYSRSRLYRGYLATVRGGSRGAFLEGFALYLGSICVLSLGIHWLWPEAPLFVRGAVTLLAPLAALWPLLRGISWRELRRGAGWHRGRGFWREIGAGLVGYLAGIPLFAVAIVFTLILSRFAGGPAMHPIVNFMDGGIAQIIGLYLLAAVWAPITEETMFRGLFYHSLRDRMPWALSALLIGVIFAAIHPQGWVAIPVLTTLAFNFAAIREWRGSIIAPMTAHALNNTSAVTVLLLMLG